MVGWIMIHDTTILHSLIVPWIKTHFLAFNGCVKAQISPNKCHSVGKGHSLSLARGGDDRQSSQTTILPARLFDLHFTFYQSRLNGFERVKTLTSSPADKKYGSTLPTN